LVEDTVGSADFPHPDNSNPLDNHNKRRNFMAGPETLHKEYPMIVHPFDGINWIQFIYALMKSALVGIP
jgi:hypothetical protein